MEAEHTTPMKMTITEVNTPTTNPPPRQTSYNTGKEGQTTLKKKLGEQYTNLIGKEGEEGLAKTRSREMNWARIVKTNRPHSRIPEAKDKMQQSKNLPNL